MLQWKLIDRGGKWLWIEAFGTFYVGGIGEEKNIYH